VEAARLSVAQLSEASDWLRDHEKSLHVQSASAQNETERDQVAECRPLWPDVEKSMMMHGQNAAQLNSVTLHAANDPTSPISVEPYKMSTADTSCLTLHLSKKTKVLRPPVELTAQSGLCHQAFRFVPLVTQCYALNMTFIRTVSGLRLHIALDI